MASRPATPNCDRPSKRQRLCSPLYFEDPSKEVQWSDIEPAINDSGADNAEPGWIAGQVFMIFASRQKSEIQIKSPEYFQLKISITCPQYGLFKFCIGQCVRISLRGACVTKLKGGTSAIGFMPFNLVFKDGAAIKYMDGRNGMQDGEVVDSWQASSNTPEPISSQANSDWFISTPIREERPAGPDFRSSSVSVATCSSRSDSLPNTPGKNEQSVPTSSVTISSGDFDESNATSLNQDTLELAQDVFLSESKVPAQGDSPQVESGLPSEGKEKSSKKRDTRHKNQLREASIESDTDSRDPEQPRKRKLRRAERKRLRREQEERQRSPSPPKRNPALDLVAGVSTEVGAYPPLGDLRPTQLVHVIGVVAYSEEPVITRKGDFKVTLILVDPSKYENGKGFKITCFMRMGFEHLLPAPSKGHVLLIRNVRAAEWAKGINGTVYIDRLKWVGYNPDTGKIYYPSNPSTNSQNSSERDASYQPRESEIQYLIQLGEWWRAIKQQEEIGAIQIAEFSHRRPLEHRLIGTCQVDIFFNATVELLKLEEADSDQTMLFFTDYTPHPQRSSEGYFGQWCIHASTSRIDPCILDTMRPGQYWSISNMRLKIGSTGALEADLYNARFSEVLDEEDDIHLPELLKRREAYLREHPPECQGGARGEPTDSPLSAISEPGHYTILAELIYSVNIRPTATDLYVSDYTGNPLISTIRPEGLKRQLNGKPITILQITAWDGHELVRDMEIGSVYTFSDVRIVSQQQDGSLKGNLKFADKRITRMSIKRADNPSVLALLQRKKDFSESRPVSVPPEAQSTPSVQDRIECGPAITISDAIKSRHKDQPKSMIKQIKGIRKCPNKFRLIARIVDYFPLDMSDFTVRMCTNCKQRIPDNRNACLMCEDMMGEYVKWIFRFFLQLEDEDGERIIIDASSEAKYFLLNIEPCDLKENGEILMTVKRRLQGCLGNLVEVHEALKRQELVEAQYGPYFDLAIKSWEIENDGRKEVVYALTGCEAVELPKTT